MSHLNRLNIRQGRLLAQALSAKPDDGEGGPASQAEVAALQAEVSELRGEIAELRQFTADTFAKLPPTLEH